MRVKLDKLTATAKGFLTRRLLQSDKVQELVKTIKVREARDVMTAWKSTACDIRYCKRM